MEEDFSTDNLKYLEELDQFLREHCVDREEIVIMGSACLAIRDIRPQGDIDILCDPDVRDKLPTEANVKMDIRSGGGQLGIDDKDVIYNDEYHDIVDGWKILRPEIYLSKKRLKQKRKDRMDKVYLEQYAFQNPDDWDWTLVRRKNEEWEERIVGGVGSTPIKSFFDILRNEGIVALINDGTQFVFDRMKAALEINPFDEYMFYYQSGKAISKTTEKYIGIDELLSNCYKNGDFNRYDLLYQMLLFKSEILEEDLDLDSEVYNLDEINEFHRDIDLYKEWTRLFKGKPVVLDNQNEIIRDGGLVRAIIEDEMYVPIKYNFESTKKTSTSPLSDELKTQLDPLADDLLKSLKRQYGLYFYVIVWPAAIDDFHIIEDHLADRFDIIGSSTIYRGNINKFAKKIYSSHNMNANAGVGMKLADLVEQTPDNGDNLGIIVLDDPQRDSHRDFSMDLQDKKEEIREHFKRDKHYTNRQHILHTTGHWRENRELNDWILNTISDKALTERSETA
jgi:hypothetical protein